MEALKREVYIPENHHITLDFDLPANIPVGKAEVVLVVESVAQSEKAHEYNFDDVFGKLEWTGDAVAEQRALRDEW